MGPKDSAQRRSSRRQNKPVTNNHTLTKFFAVTAKDKKAPEPLPKPLVEPAMPDRACSVESSDSSSDVELVDASQLLGGAPTASTPTAVAAVPAERKATAYRNTMKSLVQASAQRRYDAEFLEQHVGNDDGSESTASATESEADSAAADMAAADMPDTAAGHEKAQRLRACLQARAADSSAASRVSVFSGIATQKNGSSGSASVESGVCGGCPTSLRLEAAEAALLGHPLQGSTGNALLRRMCLGSSTRASESTYRLLLQCLDRQRVLWQLAPAAVLVLLDQLLGHPQPSATTATPSSDDTRTRANGDEECTDSTVRKGARRAGWLLDVASRALYTGSAVEGARVVASTVLVLADHRCSAANSGLAQRALQRLADRLGPPGFWAVACKEAATRAAQRLGALPLAVSGRIVAALPAGSPRCAQLRGLVALALLRAHVPAGIEGSALAGSALAAFLVDPAQQLFSVGTPPDYARLEAAVRLLGCVLGRGSGVAEAADDGAVHLARIREWLALLNRRISDGMADDLAKTLAKDAVQILLVRLRMTEGTGRSRARRATKHRESLSIAL
ncbi:hypothetical protein GGI07_004306 [Coemansia sp. Benny D115]|nr:hypothetical protein GGI07_004306 [Coemansia sp. Benny D115]